MAFIPKIEFVELGRTAESITIKDTTGVYDVSTNSGGYGTPNPNSPEVTTKAYLLLKYWTENEYSSPMSLSVGNIASIQGAGLSITPIDLGLSTDSSVVFSDGEHQIKYIPAQSISGTGAFVSGSKIVILSSSSGIATLLNNLGLVWVLVVVSGITYAFEVDSAGINNDTQITLKTVSTVTTSGATVIAGGDADLKVLVNKAAEACIVSSTGALADIPGSCLDVEATLNKLIRWQIAAVIQHQCQDYEGAHNLVVSINKYCTSGKCICNS